MPSIHIKFADGREISRGFQTGDFTLGTFGFNVAERLNGGLTEYIISLTPAVDGALAEVTVEYPLGETAVGECDSVLVYDNSYCSNMFASIREFANDEDTTRSREIVSVKSGNGVFSCAFTSCDRFFTDFYVWRHLVSVRFYLENKTLRTGETYTLESFAVDSGDALAFFEKYTAVLAERYVTRPRKAVPFGWSSWSCMYGKVTEENLIPEIKNIARIVGEGGVIQVDDGWQGNESFRGEWKYDTEKFPSGGAYPAKVAHENGLTYGLWIAPALVHDKAPLYESLDELIYRENGEKKPTFMTVYPLDIGRKEVLDSYRRIFTRMKDEYGADYFKIDFLVNLITRIADTSKLTYDAGFAVEVYRNFTKVIRETVGDEIFLNACGAPIGESAGVFDGIRTSSDITWDGVGDNPNITWWEIFVKNIQNIILRSPYDRVFITDPDGLVVRGYKTPYGNDCVELSDSEALCYATAVRMSGGHILLNEETERLGDERMKLFTDSLPPISKAARPANFFDFPYCTESYVTTDGGDTLVALWNLGEDETERTLDTKKYVGEGEASVTDGWTHEKYASADGKITFKLPKHSVKMCRIEKK